MEVAAENATALPSEGRARINASTTASQTDWKIKKNIRKRRRRRQKTNLLTSADWRTVLIDVIEKSRERTITTERKHHSRV